MRGAESCGMVLCSSREEARGDAPEAMHQRCCTRGAALKVMHQRCCTRGDAPEVLHQR